MNNVLGMNELDSFTDLSHDADTGFLGQQEVFADRSIEQLTAVYTANNSNTVTTTRCSRSRQTSPPVPPPGELDETYASSLILAYSVHCLKM